MPKKKHLIDKIVRINLSRKPHPQKKVIMGKIMDDARIIDIDIRPIEWDPFPKLSKEIELGGWPKGIKHIKKKFRKKNK